MRGAETGLCGLNHPVQVLASNLGRERRAARGRLILFALLLAVLMIVPHRGFADPFPPLWVNGTGPAIHFSPALWPNEPANPVNFGDRLAAGTVAVPTMTEWGMMLFVLLAGSLAAAHPRRLNAHLGGEPRP